MAYRVSLSAPAEDDAYAAFERIREAAPMHAEQWLVRLFAAIDRGEGPAAASDASHGECPAAVPGCHPTHCRYNECRRTLISVRMRYFTVTIAESGWVCRHVKYAC